MQRASQIVKDNYSKNNHNRGLYNKPSIAIGAEEQDQLIEWADDLIHPDYRLWFIKRLKAVGKKRFVDAANKARRYDGLSRQRVFAHLLKS